MIESLGNPTKGKVFQAFWIFHFLKAPGDIWNLASRLIYNCIAVLEWQKMLKQKKNNFFHTQLYHDAFENSPLKSKTVN